MTFSTSSCWLVPTFKGYFTNVILSGSNYYTFLFDPPSVCTVFVWPTPNAETQMHKAWSTLANTIHCFVTSQKHSIRTFFSRDTHVVSLLLEMFQIERDLKNVKYLKTWLFFCEDVWQVYCRYTRDSVFEIIPCPCSKVWIFIYSKMFCVDKNGNPVSRLRHLRLRITWGTRSFCFVRFIVYLFCYCCRFVSVKPIQGLSRLLYQHWASWIGKIA